MPIYDYRCIACNNTSELLIRGNTTPTCPACGSQQMEKLVSAPAAPGKSAGIVAKARKQAAKEGHFSNY
jgi:putative FmdB family regulatory protein